MERRYTLKQILGMMAYEAGYNGEMTCKLPGSILGSPNAYGAEYGPDAIKNLYATMRRNGWISMKGLGPVLTEDGYKVAEWPF
jgi:hypothetical protein